MKLTLIICTYKRSKVITDLLDSVVQQTLYPDEVLIVDGSPDDLTKEVLAAKSYKNLVYFKVDPEDRGLTKQRNFGIERVNSTTEIIGFLDDDTVLDTHYFENLLETYSLHPKALGVGGYINNEVQWQKVEDNYKPSLNEFFYDGYKRKDGSRFVIRKKLHLDSDCAPGWSSNYSHGRSIGFLPPSGKIYEVEQLMGGVSSFKKEVFETLQFAAYFEGYGLYEDADFTIRVAKMGKLFVNTSAQLSHYHDPAGRPNKFQYGKMVVRNGWYVWRVKNPSPNFKDRCKWHAVTVLLISIRATNIITSADKKQALTETAGRIVGWCSLAFNTPK
ncbi:glycosyltransferase family 2 protein [Flavobacterium antarcticum]|uniref:glycosyltransferase family 2 protein n=1 Tax=Flavobacterium antarcticum TaxID=271155 RepID=UPI0003B3C0DC|nr:glycosyltransferase family 2 protein [Flavobacterium antarcticum]